MFSVYFFKILRSIGLIIVLYCAWVFLVHIIERHFSSNKYKTIKTFVLIIKSVAKWSFFAIGSASVLSHFIDISPLIYGLSFFGLAASMGSQTLVKDIINGAINLIEGNISLGEVITVGTFSGTVENISLRSIVLRHSSGTLQTIPFSEITSIKNHSRNYSVTCVELIFKTGTKKQDVSAALNLAWENLEPSLKKQVLEGPEIDKVFVNNYGLNIRIRAKTTPDPQNVFSNAFHESMSNALLTLNLNLADPIKS
jgi:small-conductance mechanosensitive channel